MKFADITNDIAFRKIFGNENKKKSLISFLNAVISLPQNEPIVDVEITNPYQLGTLSGGKSTIVDVKAKDKNGNTFIVEMQVAEYDFFHKRILYYTSQSYTAQIGTGEQYDKLKPVYFIGILQFEIGNNPNYYSRHKVLDVQTHEHVVRDVEFNFIELPKFQKTLEQLTNNIDQWTYFIKNAKDLTIIPEEVRDEGLKEAYREADKQNWTQLELDDYLRASLKIRDDIGRLELAERRAKEKGEAIGKEIGEAIGKEIGKEMATLSLAKTMKDNNEPLDKISLYTGLSLDQLLDI